LELWRGHAWRDLRIAARVAGQVVVELDEPGPIGHDVSAPAEIAPAERTHRAGDQGIVKLEVGARAARVAVALHRLDHVAPCVAAGTAPAVLDDHARLADLGDG